MPFRFKKSESPAKAVRRLCRECIGDALDRLREHRPANVHDVRKEIKKLRAILRLVGGEIGNDIYHKGAKALRKAAGRLAAPRDARVKLRTFEKLAGRTAWHFAGIEKALRKNYRREKRRFQKNDSIVIANRILRKADRRVDDLKIKAVGWSAIEPGLRQSYRRGRKIYELVRKYPSPENFHEWRKDVKDLWYYLRMLRPAWPREIRAMTDGLGLLGEQLGDDHDLVLLKQFVKENCGKHVEEVEELNKLIETHQEKLRSMALKRGAKFFAGKPTTFCRRFETYWQAWHGEK